MYDLFSRETLWWMSVAGTAIFFIALLVIPLLAIRLPRDYLLRRSTFELRWGTRAQVLRSLAFIARNALGWILLVGGIPFLILPGPGTTMVFVGILLAEFPRKRRFVFWLLTRGAVHHTLNWFREKAKREPLIVPGERP